MRRKRLTQLIQIPRILDECDLCFMQTPDHVSFPIKRVYYIFNRMNGLPRGHHAHKKTKQILFCIQGSIEIVLDDGKRRESVLLDHPETGVVINNKIWHEMKGFKKNTILLVLASKVYDPKDYIRNYEEFLAYMKKHEKNKI